MWLQVWRLWLWGFSAILGAAWGLHSLPQQCERCSGVVYALKAIVDGNIAWLSAITATQWTAVGSIAVVLATIA